MVAFYIFSIVLGVLMLMSAARYVVGLVFPAIGSKVLGHLWPGRFVDAQHRRQAKRVVVIQALVWGLWGTGILVEGLTRRFGQQENMWDEVSLILRFIGPLLLFVALRQQRGLPRQ